MRYKPKITSFKNLIQNGFSIPQVTHTCVLLTFVYPFSCEHESP